MSNAHFREIEPHPRPHRTAVRRWPKARRLLSSGIFFLLAILVLGATLIFGVWLSTSVARVRGESRGFLEGYAQGHADTCQSLAVQVHWVYNVESNLVSASKEDPDIANKVKSASGSGYQYTCPASGVRITPTIYYPQVSAPPVPLGKLSMPVSKQKTGCPPCLLAGMPSPKPTPKPTPSN